MNVNRKVHLHVDIDPTINLVMIRMSMYYLADLKDRKPLGTKYFVSRDLKIEKVILFFNDFNPDEDQIGFEMSVDGGNGGDNVRCSNSTPNMALKWVLIMMFMMILELK